MDIKSYLLSSPLDYQSTNDELHYLNDESISRLNTLQLEAHTLFPLPDNISVERFSKPTYINLSPRSEPATSRSDILQRAEQVLQDRYGSYWNLIKTAPDDRFYGETTRFHEELMIEAIEYMRELQKQKIHSMERVLLLKRQELWEEMANQKNDKKVDMQQRKSKLDPNSLEALLKGLAPEQKVSRFAPKQIKKVNFSPIEPTPKPSKPGDKLSSKVLGSHRVPVATGKSGLKLGSKKESSNKKQTKQSKRLLKLENEEEGRLLPVGNPEDTIQIVKYSDKNVI